LRIAVRLLRPGVGHSMPPPVVTAKPAETPAVAANPLWAIPLSALTATLQKGEQTEKLV
jgi:hypothetical protein